MPAILRDFGYWFWRLVPANPILVRVVYAGGRRVRHLWIRAAYLAVLAISVMVGVLGMLGGGETSLADLAKNATSIFKYVSLIQLGMVSILAPVFTAAAITQEKDSQTYNILLSTPLTNGQIVLGSLLSRLYFVIVLLMAGVPLFCIMMVYGGVTGDRIAMAIALSAATALITGSIAITISVIKIGTGRTIFSFYLAIAIYLIAIYGLSFSPALIPPEAEPAPGPMQTARMSWLAAAHPFLAMEVVLGEKPAPEFGAVAHYGFPWKYFLAYPASSYIVLTVLISAALLVLSLFFVRRGEKEGEETFFTRLFGRAGRPGEHGAESGGDQTRKPRNVSRNPIAWREAVTGAAAGGGFFVRYGVMVVGLMIAVVLLIYYGLGEIPAAQTQGWLFGLVAVELGIALFIATSTAATSMTREKESNTLELLLATPLTSTDIIWGKIRGLITAAWPLLLVPYVTVLLFILYGWLFSRAGPVVPPEALLTLPVLFVCFTAFGCMLGLQASIKQKKTIGAVFTSMGLMIAAFGLSWGCTVPLVGAGPEVAAAFMPFTPVAAVHLMLNPEAALIESPNVPLKPDQLVTCRVIAVIASVCSALAYSLIGYSLHRSMVRNFDMVIRKQTA